MAKLLGRRGGLNRAARLSPARRKQIAASGGAARASSLRAARRIEDNFRFAAAAEALRRRSHPSRRRERGDNRRPPRHLSGEAVSRGAYDHLEDVGAVSTALSHLGLTPVLVGGMALVILGSRRVTRDFDFVIAKPEQRLGDLVAMLYDRGF